MKKGITQIVVLLLCAMLLAGCQCKHEWVDADCTNAKTCSLCGETEGTELGHTWIDATCTEAKRCDVCDAVEGEALGHTPGEEEITEDKVTLTTTTEIKCSDCGEIISTETVTADSLVEGYFYVFSPEEFLDRFTAVAKTRIPSLSYEISEGNDAYSASFAYDGVEYMVQFLNDCFEFIAPDQSSTAGTVWGVALTGVQEVEEPALVMNEDIMWAFCNACDPKFDDSDTSSLTLSCLTSAMNALEFGEPTGYDKFNEHLYELTYAVWQDNSKSPLYAAQNIIVYSFDWQS